MSCLLDNCFGRFGLRLQSWIRDGAKALGVRLPLAGKQNSGYSTLYANNRRDVNLFVMVSCGPRAREFSMFKAAESPFTLRIVHHDSIAAQSASQSRC
jgi:hypothetical protein